MTSNYDIKSAGGPVQESAAQEPLPEYHGNDSNPPQYDTLEQQAQAHLSSLADGDPNESIDVPMITRKGGTVGDSLHWMNPFSRKFGPIKTSVTTRKMPRDFYLKHYAKDAQGNYVGTGAPAPDAAMVFVPSKSSPEEVQEMVDQVSLGRQDLRGGGIGKFGQPLHK